MSDARSSSGSADAVRSVRLWLEQQIENAEQDQISGFAAGTAAGTLRGERAHARNCAMYEAKQIFLAAFSSGGLAQAAPEPLDYGDELLRWSNIEVALRKKFPTLNATGIEIDNWPALIDALAMSSTPRETPASEIRDKSLTRRAVDITGWKLVPDRPTEEMWQAGRSADIHPGDSYTKVWSAMFDAAPDVDDCETASSVSSADKSGAA